MAKTNSFNMLSNKRCQAQGCRKQLKQNLVDRNPDAEFCYLDYKRKVRTAKEYRAILRENKRKAS